MAEEMQSFLSDRRISIAELTKRAASDSGETVAQRNKRLRDLAIKKRVSFPAPSAPSLTVLLSVSHRNPSNHNFA